MLSTMIDILSTPSTSIPICTMAWATLYQVFCHLPGFKTRPFAFVNRSVAIVHALVAVAMVTPLIFFDEGLKVGGPNTRSQLLVLCMTGGYFTFDIISWLWNGIARNKMDWLQIFHHAAVLTSLSYTFRLGFAATDCALGLLIAEVANPFLYMRYILWVLGMDNHALGKLNMRIFMFILTLTVPLAGPILAYYIINVPHNVLFHKASVSGLIVVNLYWYMLFVQKFLGLSPCDKKPSASQMYNNSTTTKKSSPKPAAVQGAL